MGCGPFFFITNRMLNRRSDKLELLRIAEAVALEKSIDKELIIDSMESGIAKAAKSKFGSENEIKVLINRDNGDIGIFRKLIIVDKPENSNLEISLNRAIELNEENKIKKIGWDIAIIWECETKTTEVLMKSVKQWMRTVKKDGQ